MREREPIPESEARMGELLMPDQRSRSDFPEGTPVVVFVPVDRSAKKLREGVIVEDSENRSRLTIKLDEPIPKPLKQHLDGRAPRDRLLVNAGLLDIELMRKTDYDLMRANPARIDEWVSGYTFTPNDRKYLAGKLRGPGIEPVDVPISSNKRPDKRRASFRRMPSAS